MRSQEWAYLDQILGETGSFERLLNTLGDERSLRRRFQEDRISGEERGDESITLDHV